MLWVWIHGYEFMSRKPNNPKKIKDKGHLNNVVHFSFTQSLWRLQVYGMELQSTKTFSRNHITPLNPCMTISVTFENHNTREAPLWKFIRSKKYRRMAAILTYRCYTVRHQLRGKVCGRPEFRWDWERLDALPKALQPLPKTLDNTYSPILCSIDEEYLEHTFNILSFIG